LQFLVYGLLQFRGVFKRQKRLKKKAKLKALSFDKQLFFMSLILTAFGVIAVADASSVQSMSSFSDPYYFAKQQIMWSLVGIGGLVFAASVHFLFWKKISYLVFFLSIALLFAVLIPGVGSRVLGARRWIYIGPLGFQPSEFAKLGLAFAFARIMASKDYKKWVPLAVLGAVGSLIMLQPDFGTMLVLIFIGVSQLFVGGYPFFYLVGVGLIGVLSGALLIFFSDYRRERLMTFFQSSSDPLGSSYHIRQILIAFGSGGLFGVGLGQSRQKQLFLPETATDSVFAVIAEEMGFFVAVLIVVFLSYFVIRLYTISMRCEDTFGLLLGVGISSWIGGQMFLNLASMLALTPLTGIPLPFFSYGGSSLTMILFSVGILLNISKYGGK